MSFVASLFALAALHPATPYHAVLKYSLAGSDVGTNVYDEQADGSFTSHTEIKLGQNPVTSDIAGKWNGSGLDSFTYTESAGKGKLSVTLKAGKLTADGLGQHHELPYNFKGQVFFANFHPQLMRNVADAITVEASGRHKISMFAIEAVQPMDVDVVTLPARNGRRGTSTEVALGFELDLKTVQVDFYTLGDQRVVGEEAKSQQFQACDADVSGLFVDPLAAYPELSQPTFKTKKVEGVKIPMRDGVKLVYDAIVPDAPGKFPVILARTPYGRKDQVILGAFYASRGYAYVVQDVRGREESDGAWDPMVNERKDGYDTIEWLAKQPWCSGSVGMIGASYGGYVQWAAAVEHPKALKCIIPQVSPPDAFINIPYEYGTLPLLADLWWLNIVRNKHTDLSTALATLAPKPAGLLKLPLTEVPKATFGYDLPMFATWIKRDRAADWKGFDIEKDLTSVKIPVLHISGWWDGDGIGTENHWTRLAAAHKSNQWLIEGPWTHAFNTNTRLGEYEFGPGALRELDSIYLRWFDTWLKGKAVNLEKMPKASVFMTGENRWHETDVFPEPSAAPVKWYLSSGEKLGAGPGDGSSKYTYDPASESVPALPKPLDTAVSLKLNGIEKKAGVLMFRGEPFDADTSLEGPITVNAFVKADVVDTDLYALLADEAPDGTLLGTTQSGKLRLEYRNGFAKPELMKPGTVYHVTLHPWWFAHRFGKGHRLVLLLLSSEFPGS
ncbi:MAG TPA: CocE/NonD family hydrolase, partial [Fimbriimonadaceae bacterium]|nr:CocE/NonD family hydrolase [Fimbriimonadaceae bacterium]